MLKTEGWDAYLCPGESDTGVVVVHEVYGLTDYEESVASLLASGGYWAVAMDLYRGKKAASLEDGFKLRNSLKREEILSCLGAGVSLLKAKGVKRIGTLGFCMGGGFALLGACNLNDISFCVDYYGAIENAEEVGGLKGPTLLILASEDQKVTPWAYSAFFPAATRHKKRVEAHLYPNTGHAFHRRGGERYKEEAANDAWERTLDFLARTRKQGVVPARSY